MRQGGFTLIELSIVLVVIALLAGGVLVGRDLIHAAQVRTTVRQSAELELAVRAFGIKYNCLPGDCPNAEEYGFDYVGDGGLAHGNGDGKIMNYFMDEDSNEYYEDQIAFKQMENAGYLKDVSGFNERLRAKITRSKSCSGLGALWHVTYIPSVEYNNYNAGHYFWITGSYSVRSDCLTVLKPADGFALDSKMDDGLPRQGRILASGNFDADGPNETPYPFVSDTGAAGANSPYCITNDTTPAYNVANTNNGDLVNMLTGPLCVLTFKAAF